MALVSAVMGKHYAKLKKRKYPFYKQLDQRDCGPICLQMICKYHGRSFEAPYLAHISSKGADGTTMGGLADASEAVGLASLALSVDYHALSTQIPLPCIAHWRQRHYVVVYEADASGVLIGDPAFGLINYSREEFLKGWLAEKKTDVGGEGILMALEATPAFFSDENSPRHSNSLFSFLGGYFHPYRRFAAQLFLGMLLAATLQLALPFLTQEIVDTGINTRNLSFVSLVLLAQLMIFISQSTLSVIRNWVILHVTSRINLSMLSDFLRKLLALPIAFFESKSTGDIMQRIQDHGRIQAFLSVTTLDALFSVVTLTIFGVLLFYYERMLFLIFLLGTLIYVAWILVFLKKRAAIDFRYFDQASGNQSSTIQLINGIQEIKLNGSEKRRRWEWEGIQARLFKLNIVSLSLSLYQTEGGRFINEIKNILISFVAARSVINGDLTLGGMLSVQYIIGQMNVPVNNFISFIRNYQDAKLSLVRLSEIHQMEVEEDSAALTVKELLFDKSIRLSEVSFQYGSSRSPLILKNVSLFIPEGKVTAIVGPSGSGKTTLLKLLMKYHEPSSGRIEVGKVPLSGISHDFWRGQCGVVLQEGYIFSDSIARNISESDVHGGIDRKRLSKAIQIANIQSFIEGLPNGLNTRIGDSGVGISGGQKQRVLIARAAYKDPDYLFFDEATSALDAENEAVIMENLEHFYTGKTVVIVAHRLSTVKNADQIIVLKDGVIVETGTHGQLASAKGYYYSLVKNQLELGN